MLERCPQHLQVGTGLGDRGEQFSQCPPPELHVFTEEAGLGNCEQFADFVAEFFHRLQFSEIGLTALKKLIVFVQKRGDFRLKILDPYFPNPFSLAGRFLLFLDEGSACRTAARCIAFRCSQLLIRCSVCAEFQGRGRMSCMSRQEQEARK